MRLSAAEHEIQGAFELTLPKPPSVNQLYARGRNGVFLSPKYRAWRKAAGLSLLFQRRSVIPIRGPYRLHLILSSKSRRGDCDNFVKAPMDLLKEHGLTPDDRYCEKSTSEWGDAQPGTCRVIVGPAENIEDWRVLRGVG